MWSFFLLFVFVYRIEFDIESGTLSHLGFCLDLAFMRFYDEFENIFILFFW